jgi:hypothetical protein
MIFLLTLLKKENRPAGTYLRLGLLLWIAAGASPAQAGAVTPAELGKMIVYGLLPACGAFFGVLAGLALGLFEPDLPLLQAAPLPAVVPSRPAAQPAGGKQQERYLAQPVLVSSSLEQVIIKGQPALDVLVRLGMAKRVVTPQGGQVLPLNLDPQSPVSAIAYFLDEQGYLQPEIAIAYTPPAAMPDGGELSREDVEPPPAEQAEENVPPDEGKDPLL